MKTSQNWRVVRAEDAPCFEIWTARDETPGSRNNYVIADGIQLESEAFKLAAAPEMLMALEMCQDVMRRAFPNGLPIQQGTFCEELDWNTALMSAQSAIAKAKQLTSSPAPALAANQYSQGAGDQSQQ